MSATPFRIDVPEAVLDDLQQRLSLVRLPAGIDDDDDWDYGANPKYIAKLCRYWQTEFDWRDQERRLNAFAHFRAEVDGFGLHFVHAKGKGKKCIPLLLIHGWPDSFARFLKIIPLLTDPAAHDSPSSICFDVVAPSLPGFGFSDRPTKKGFTFKFGDLLHELMHDVLGYERYAVHGGDWGTTVAESMARSHASSILGLHLTDVPYAHMFQKPDDPSAAEKKYLKQMEKFQQKEGAYALIQSTKPESLACGLNDSPAGLAAWLVEKFRDWSDSDGDVESRFSRDELLTHIMIYWATQTIDSSFFPYYDMANAGALRWMSEAAKNLVASKQVPAAFALFPKDLVTPPKEWAERFFNVQRWTEMPRGGHFAALEEPELLARDLRATFAKTTERAPQPSSASA